MPNPHHPKPQTVAPAASVWWRRRLQSATRAVTATTTVAIGLALSACGGNDSATVNPPTATAMTAVNSVMSCADMAKQDFGKVTGLPTTVSSATVSGANCVLTGTINGTQNYQVRLPTTGWTQRFMMNGCGGYCGSVADPRTTNGTMLFGCKPIEQNDVALATTDLGHKAGISSGTWAKDNPSAVIDFAYLGMHKMAVLSKALINAYYGQPPKKSYFVGCSDGGREGLQVAQRFPEDFDGIVVGAPVIDETATNTFYHAWNIRVNMDPVTGNAIFTTDKKPALIAAVTAACGDEGGLIQDPRTCDGEKILASLLCTGADSSSCLTAAQVDVVRQVWRGPTDETGTLLSPGDMPIGSEGSWSSVTLAGTNPDTGGEGAWASDFPNYMADWGSGTGITYKNMEFTSASYTALTKLSNLWDPHNPDLSRFAARGGKLIIWHGWADSGASPYMALNYWSAVRKQMGADTASQFMTLYMIPGVGHCNGGINATRTDFLTPMIDWVENGTAPGKVTVNFVSTAQTSAILNSRPVFPYPSIVKYDGKGNIADESSWVRAAVATGVSDTLTWRGLADYAPLKQMWCEPVPGSSIPSCSLK